MAVRSYIVLQPDRFAEHFKEETEYKPWEGFDHVRRPFRGILRKQDTYATLRIVDQSGKSLFIPNTSSRTEEPRSQKFSNFLVQQITEARQEKFQVVETFGEPYILFYGERPRVININGVLLNTPDFRWRDEFLQNYEKVFRGTKLVEKRARLLLSWEDVVVEGYLTGVNIQETANQPNSVGVSFTLFLTNYGLKKPLTNKLPYTRVFGVWVDKSWEVAAGTGEQLFKSTTDDVWRANLKEIKAALADPRRQLLATADVVVSALRQAPNIIGDVQTIANAIRQGNALQLGSMSATFSYQALVSLLSRREGGAGDIPTAPRRFLNDLSLVQELKALARQLFGAAYKEPVRVPKKLTPPKGSGYIYENEDEFVTAKRQQYWGREKFETRLEKLLEETKEPIRLTNRQKEKVPDWLVKEPKDWKRKKYTKTTTLPAVRPPAPKTSIQIPIRKKSTR